MLCREQIAQLRDVAADIRARQARLAFIGNGSPDQAKNLARDLALDVPLYTDPERRGFAALDAQRSLANVLHPGTLSSVLRAWRGGHRQQGVQGDALQLGAVVIVRPGNDVVYLHRSAYAGDHPASADILRRL